VLGGGTSRTGGASSEAGSSKATSSVGAART
jgi:hypothetical protein